MSLKKRKPLWTETAQHMVDFITRAFVENGRPKEQAEEDGLLVVDTLIRQMGGALIYIPRALVANIVERNEAIKREFTGNNHMELAAKYGVSYVHIYRIVRNPMSPKIGRPPKA